MERPLEIVFTEGLGGALKEAASKSASLGEVIYLPLCLGYGPLEEDVFGPQRLETLERLYAAFPEGKEAAATQLEAAKKNWQRLLERLEPGLSLRFWVGQNPDEASGLCWLLSMLPRDLNLYLQVLPSYVQRGECMVQYRGWEEMEPSFLAEQPLPEPAPRLLAMAAEGRWNRFRQENAPLRGFVGSSLCSLPADYYDYFLLQQARELGSSFTQALLIGRTLGRDQLQVQAGWLNQRVQYLLEQGDLQLLKTAKDPYRRLLGRGRRL